MYEIIQYGNEAFVLFIFPLIGLLLEKRFSTKQLYRILTIAFILIAPVFTSYQYAIPYILRLFVLALFSAAFAIYMKNEKESKIKVRKAWITTSVLFFLFGFLALLDSLAGFQEVEKRWRVGRYKVEYIKDQGFAGGPLMKYQLSKYSLIPLFIKQLDIAVDSDTANRCLIKFSDSRMIFNKCNSRLTKMVR